MQLPTKKNKIMRAIATGDLDTVKAMLEKTPQLMSNPYIVRDVFKKGTDAIVAHFMSVYPLEKAYNDRGWTVMHLATELGRLDAVRQCFARYPDFIHRATNEGVTALHVAAGNDQPEIITYLLGYGANIEAREKYGYTPLHFAAEKNYAGCVALLLARGADAKARNVNGSTPKELSKTNDVLYCLMQHEAGLLAQEKTVVPVAEDAPSPWCKLNAHTVIHTSESAAAGYGLTEIFNFGSGQCISVQRNLKTNIETAVCIDMHNLAGRPLLEQAAEELTRLGGQAPTVLPGLIGKKALSL